MAQSNNIDYTKATSIYDFTAKEAYGRDVPMEMYRGKVLLIVNFAARCNMAKDNYPKLTQLRKNYYDMGSWIKFELYNYYWNDFVLFYF